VPVAQNDRLVRNGVQHLRLAFGQETNGAVTNDARTQAVRRYRDAIDGIGLDDFVGVIGKKLLGARPILVERPLLARNRAIRVPVDADEDGVLSAETVVVVEVTGVPSCFLVGDEFADRGIVEARNRALGRGRRGEHRASGTDERGGNRREFSQLGFPRQHTSPTAQRQDAVYIPCHGTQ